VIANIWLFYTRNIIVYVEVCMHIMNFTIKPRCEVPALQIFGSSYVLSSGVKISLLIYAH